MKFVSLTLIAFLSTGVFGATISKVRMSADKTEFIKHEMEFGVPGEAPDCGALVSKLQMNYRSSDGLDQAKMKQKSSQTYELEVTTYYTPDSGQLEEQIFLLNYHPQLSGNNFTDCKLK